jgi:hypothetical protein
VTLLERMKSVVSSRAWPGAATWVASAQVQPLAAPPPPPFVADETYLRVWLAEVRLEHSRNWFTEWHPLVHTAVERRYGTTVEEQVCVVSPGSIPGFDGAANSAVTVEKELTLLLPFAGGTVSINVGLVAVRGDNTVRQLIEVVGGFAGLAIPGIETGTKIAGQVVDAFERLFGLGAQIGTLAYDSTLALGGGGAPVSLTPGYLAVLDEAPPLHTLWVQMGHLISWAGQGQPVTVPTGSFLLLRLESRTDRDDWRHLDAIAEPLREARRSTDAETRRAHYQRSIIAARTSPELHEADRIRIAVALRELRDDDSGYGAVAGGSDHAGGELATVAGSAALSAKDALTTRPSLASLLA